MERLYFAILLSFMLLMPRLSSGQTTLVPIYKPPQAGATSARVGGGSRGGGALTLSPLAPDHAGYTISPKPAIYWYLSQPTENPVEFVLTDEQAIEPLLRIQVEGVNKPGIYQLNLSKYEVSLKSNREYQWFVALVFDSAQRANDIVAGGIILRTAPSSELLIKLKTGDQRRLPFIYADEGLWYDAIMAISNLIERRPNDRTLREQRAALLEQGGLPEVAAHDRGIAAR